MYRCLKLIFDEAICIYGQEAFEEYVYTLSLSKSKLSQLGLNKFKPKAEADTVTVGFKKPKKGDPNEAGKKTKKSKSADEKNPPTPESQDASPRSEQSMNLAGITQSATPILPSGAASSFTPASNGQHQEYTYERIVSDNQRLVAENEALKLQLTKGVHVSTSAVDTSVISNDDRLNDLAREYNVIAAAFEAQKEEYERILANNLQLVTANKELRELKEDAEPISHIILKKCLDENKALKQELATRDSSVELSMKYNKMEEENRLLKEELDKLHQRQAERYASIHLKLFPCCTFIHICILYIFILCCAQG